nr:NAD(P)/FAD-dependent oxidoreductase [Candidatus Levybacteria bacterium]
MKEIVVLGCGFAGVAACKYLIRKLNGNANITLIDKNSYHLFTPSLYEVATSEEPKKNITIPFSEIFGTKVRFVKGNVSLIDYENNLIRFDNSLNYSYDYLIVALGSVSSDFNIEGLKEHSLPLKWLEDGVKIRKEIESAYHKKVHQGKEINIVVGGGGFSGTELSAELINYKNRLSKHHKTSFDLIKITIIQGSSCLLKELDENVSKLAQKRLEKNGVKIILDSHIKKVSKDFIETDTGNKYSYDVFIWTGGVKASEVLEKSGFKVNGRGQVLVNEYMQVLNFKNVFAVGDIAEYGDPLTNKAVPGVAEVAQGEGRAAARNVLRSIKNKDLKAYKYEHTGYIVPLKGKFAVAQLSFVKTAGFLGWVLQQVIFLVYLLEILPFKKALMRWNKFEMYLIYPVK